MKKALVFAGQGTHKKGMGLNLIYDRTSQASTVCRRIDHVLRENCGGFSVLSTIRDNPPHVEVSESLFRSPAASCDAAARFDKVLPHNVARVMDRTGVVRITERTKDAGVLGLTYVAQPAVLTAQLIAWNSFLERNKAKTVADAGFSVIAGHSLGEFTAMAALEVLPAEAAAELVMRRGLLMDECLRMGTSHYVAATTLQMYACNPKRAQLSSLLPTSADVSSADVFLLLVELISSGLRNTTSFLEMVNYNVSDEQYVVAGDAVALAVLGKCLDPQYRANNLQFTSIESLAVAALRSVAADKAINPELLDPSKVDAPPAPDWVRSRRKNFGKLVHMRTFATPDDCHTLPMDRLTNLTLDEDGRSGLKKKSWFMPLAGIDTPFHSSLLRRAMDHFHPVVMDFLTRCGPNDSVLRDVFRRTHWVTNLTGTVFEPDSAAFRSLCADHIGSCNIGEQQRNGKYDSVLRETLCAQCRTGSVQDLLGAVLTGQLSHSVQWVDCMKSIVNGEGAEQVLEVSPVKTLCEMFRRSFGDSLTTSCILDERP
jgi:malonyl CoA-acyl carrier protein transacylase